MQKLSLRDGNASEPKERVSSENRIQTHVPSFQRLLYQGLDWEKLVTPITDFYSLRSSEE